MERKVGVSAALAAVAMLLMTAQSALAAPTGWLAIDGGVQFAGGGATYDWANSGTAPPVNACPAGAVNLSGSGGIFNCGQPGAAGAPPTAPPLTPTAAADPSLISAVFISDAIAGDTTSCGGDPTTVAGGAKNGDLLTSIGTTHGSMLAKDDLSNVYAVSHTRSDTGHPEMFFAAERLVNNGDSHIDFEFLQSNVGVTAACTGTFTGHRTEGDLLVAVDYTLGGTLAGASVWQWHCNPDPPGTQPADGTVCDPGGLSTAHYEQIAIPTFLTLAVNSGGDISCGGWVCRLGAGTTIPQNDFLEGGIDLAGIPFTGCFNSFLPHTRTAQSFSSGLKDFAGPVSFHSCRTPAQNSTSSPTGSGVSPGTATTDTVTVGNGGAGPAPTGSVTFFLCSPSQVTAGGCLGGTQIGATKALVAGSATSDSTTSTITGGRYCWRTLYTPDAASTGIFAPAAHTNATTECFGVAGASLPNTGFPTSARELGQDIAPLGGVALPLLMLLAPVRRRTSAAALVAVMALGAVSIAASPASAPATRTATLHQTASAAAAPYDAPGSVAQSGVRSAWRLVIERIGVDAPIEPVGLDALHAVASPSSLTSVGWFNRGPAPGQPGDAVIDGHYGLPAYPAVFRNLHALGVGDTMVVIWPDGHRLTFRVTATTLIARDARVPAGLFASSGQPRLSLITCGGAWQQDQATYSERLVVTAVAVR